MCVCVCVRGRGVMGGTKQPLKSWTEMPNYKVRYKKKERKEQNATSALEKICCEMELCTKTHRMGLLSSAWKRHQCLAHVDKDEAGDEISMWNWTPENKKA